MLGIKLGPMQFLDRVGASYKEVDPAQVQALADAICAATNTAASSSSSATAAAGPTPRTSARTSARARSAARTSTTTPKRRLRILSLTDNTPYILAWGNDEGFDRVFVEQLKNLAEPRRFAHRHQRLGQQPEHPACRRVGQPARPDTFGCTGFSGGKLKTLAQHNFHVPLDDMGIVESIHLTAFHWIVDHLHARIGLGVAPANR